MNHLTKQKKKTLKRIYKLRILYVKDRIVSKKMFELYNEKISISKTNQIISNIDISKLKKRNNDLILKMYQKIQNTDKVVSYIEKSFGIRMTTQALRVLASKNNIKKENHIVNQRTISKENEKEIIRLYLQEKKSANEIAKIFNYKNKKSVLDILKENNIDRRITKEMQHENKTYKDFNFKKIDSYGKGYFLGFLVTDGSINEQRNYIVLEITDENAIKEISELTKAKYIKLAPRCKGTIPSYRIQLYNKSLLKELKRIGVKSRKTYNLPSLNLYKDELNFLPSIIRGIIDGDGWIRKDGREFFISSASSEFIEWCMKSLLSLGFKDLKITKTKDGFYLIRDAKEYNINLLKKLIYPIDKPFGMLKKYNRLHSL